MIKEIRKTILFWGKIWVFFFRNKFENPYSSIFSSFKKLYQQLKDLSQNCINTNLLPNLADMVKWNFLIKQFCDL